MGEKWVRNPLHYQQPRNFDARFFLKKYNGCGIYEFTEGVKAGFDRRDPVFTGS
jgi:hypothetical protein